MPCVDLLGSPVGHPSAEIAAAIQIVRNLKFARLQKVQNLQERLLLLRYILSQTANHLARCVPPSVVKQALAMFDHLVNDVVIDCMETSLNELGDAGRIEIGIPLGDGGLGFHSLQELSPVAFLSSIVSVIQTWQEFLPAAHPVIDAWCRATPTVQPNATPASAQAPGQPRPAGYSLVNEIKDAMVVCHQLSVDAHTANIATAAARKNSKRQASETALTPVDLRILEKLPATIDDLLLLRVPKLQANFRRFQVVTDVARLKQQYLVEKSQKIQFLSKATSNSALWLRAHPSEEDMTFTNEQFIVALRLYMRLPQLPRFKIYPAHPVPVPAQWPQWCLPANRTPSAQLPWRQRLQHPPQEHPGACRCAGQRH